MNSFSKIVREGVTMDSIQSFNTTDNAHTNSLLEQIKKYKEEIKDSVKELQKKEIELNQTEQEFSQTDEICVNLEKDIKLCQSSLEKYETNLSEIKSKGIELDIEQIALKSMEELNKKKQDGFNEMQLLGLKNQEKQKQIIKSLEEKMKLFNSITKNYHILILLDDSGSMHSKNSKGLLSLLQQTPFEYLSESIKQFVTSRQHINGSNDKISIIKFSDKAKIIHEREDIHTISLNLTKSSQKGGTNFNAAFEQALNLVKLKSSQERTVMIFQTDGDSYLNYECQNYVKQMKAEDQYFRMFTLSLGNCLNENFLKEITKFANSDEEILNKGSKCPLFFYQQVSNPYQLTQIFTSIALGISGQIEEIQQEMKSKQAEQEQLFIKYQEKITKLEKQLDTSQTDIEQNIKKMQAINNVKDKTTYLEKEIENLKKKQQQQQEEKSKEKSKNTDSKVKLKNQTKILAEFKLEHDNQRAKKKTEIEKLEQLIEKEIEENDTYKAKKTAFMRKIGCKQELMVKIWIKATNWFDYFLRIITAFTQKFELFFDRFKDISNNLKLQIDGDNASSNSTIAFETQIEMIEQFYSGHEFILSQFENQNAVESNELGQNNPIKEQVFKKKDRIGITNLVEMILKEKCNIYNKNDNQILAALENAKSMFFHEVLNIEALLKRISYNRPVVVKKNNGEEDNRDDNEDGDDDDDDITITEKLEAILKTKQISEISTMNSKIYELLKNMINLKVIENGIQKKITNQEKIDEICNEIETFDFDYDSDNDNLEDDDEDYESTPGETDIEGQIKQSSQKKKKGEEKKKKKQDKKKKKIKLTENEVKKIVEELKSLGKSKLELLQTHRIEKEVLRKVVNLIDTQLTDTLAGFSTSKKAHQIINLQKYIQKEMIDPLDELLNFTNHK